MMGAVSPPAIRRRAGIPCIAAALPGAVSCSFTLRRRKSCFLRTCVEKKASLSGITLDVKTTFLEVYEILKFELLNDPVFEWTHDSHQWVEQMMDYNVPRGKLLRGLSVIDCYKSLTQDKYLSEDELFLASVLGWCIEWLQATSLIFDDIADNSHTRRGEACWYRVPKIGIIALNDGAILENQVPRILKKHFLEKPYYVDLLQLFNEVTYQSILGQMMDLITAIEGEKDLLKYSLTLHHHIAQYKTSCYSFYLPVACALLLAGENLDNHVNVKELLFEMGIYFQIVDDYLDCFGNPKKTGKIGTDIEDFKCSWLVLQALELCNDEQKKILRENYGKTDAAGVAKVKAIYNDLDLQSVFAYYQTNKYNELRSRVEAHPNKAVQNLIFKRSLKSLKLIWLLDLHGLLFEFYNVSRRIRDLVSGLNAFKSC